MPLCLQILFNYSTPCFQIHFKVLNVKVLVNDTFKFGGEIVKLNITYNGPYYCSGVSLKCWKCIAHDCAYDPEENYKASKVRCDEGQQCMVGKAPNM